MPRGVKGSGKKNKTVEEKNAAEVKSGPKEPHFDGDKVNIDWTRKETKVAI